MGTPDTTALLLLTPSPTAPSSLLPSNTELLDCKLVGAFSLFVQILVGTLGFSTLIIKRYFEQPRRTWLVWSFDVSKQMISGALMHMANLLVSALRGSHQEADAADATNPCSWYVLNLTLDCTVGILFVAMYLRLYERIAAYMGLAKELESGDYGTPPSWRRWLKQASIFCASMVSMKLSIIALIAIFPALVVIGDLVLKPVQMADSPRLQIVFVMAFWPLALNIFESWVLDQFIKRKHRGEESRRSASGHVPLPTEDIPDTVHTSYEMADASNMGSSRTLVGTRALLHDMHTSMDMTDIVMPSPDTNLHSIYKVRTFNDFDTDDDDYDSTDNDGGGARSSSSSNGAPRYFDKTNPSVPQKPHDD
ncbi:hypothetical protein EV178_001712 [Coemansia sp. RSA 1646]|nr:hypothetical protein EV178_001712 [Coemansia sp. RSA 1646]